MGIVNIEAVINNVNVRLTRENNITPVLVERKCRLCLKENCHRYLCAVNLKAELAKGNYRIKDEKHYE